MGHQVFVSYARVSSSEHARAVRGALEAAGISVFLDEHDIPLGSEFPAALADALLAARVVLVFADAAYFERPWCVYEFRVAVAPSRSSGDAGLPHLIVALPPKCDDLDALGAHLPPAVAQRSWPSADRSADLVTLVRQALAASPLALADRLVRVDDPAVRALRAGGAIPRPQPIGRCRGYFRDVPGSLKEHFVGRDDLMWSLFHNLETRRAGTASVSCSVVGGAGSGKSQLAAEYVWRYGANNYPGGLVWINADCDDTTLEDQLTRAAQAFDPKAAVDGLRGAPLRDAIGRAVVSGARDQAVLWVVDNIPEPTAELAAPQLSFWCPAWQHVSVLCTSRWEGLQAIDARVPVDALPEVAAIDILTQPPVERAWLTPNEWHRIVEWVGGLPLALEALRVSLAGGFTDAKMLVEQAQQNEPAAAVDAEAEALRGEVSDQHIRGVTMALQAAYARMPVGARRSAHLLARLSPYPMTSAFLAQFVAARDRGVLANRSWLKSSSEVNEDRRRERRWVMHRIYSSFLRGRSAEADVELTEIATHMRQMCQGAAGRRLLQDHSTHLVVLARALQKRSGDGALSPEALESAQQLAASLATDGIANKSDTSLRGHGAELADALGVSDVIVTRLREQCREGSEEICATAAEVLGHMPGSRRAAELLAELLRDPRSSVRRRVLNANLPSRHADILALPALEAILAEPASENPLDTPSFFSNVFEQDAPEFPELAIARLVERLSHEIPAERRRALDLLHSVYSKMLGVCEPGDPRLQPVVSALRQAALHPSDRDVASSAARTLANPGDPATHDALVATLHAAPSPAARRVAMDVLASYLRNSEGNDLPRVQLEWRDGQQSLTLFPPDRRDAAPELFAPLVPFAVDSDDATTMECALGVLLDSDAGEPLLMDAVRELYESDALERLREVGEATIRIKPGLSTGYWWRGLAAERQQRVPEAIADYGTVIELTPEFDQARSRRADLLEASGDLRNALADIDALIAAVPDDARLLYRRARVLRNLDDYEAALEAVDAALEIEPGAGALLLKGQCLLDLERHEEATDWLSRFIEKSPSFAHAWHLRAFARAKTGDLVHALADIEHVYALDPSYDSEHASSLRMALQASTRTHAGDRRRKQRQRKTPKKPAKT